MIEELEQYRRRYEAAKQVAVELTNGLTDQQFNQRPEAGGWSVAECLHHLQVTGEKLLPRIDEGLQRARARGWLSPGPFRYGWFGNWFVAATGGGELPPRRRYKAPAAYAPSPDRRLAALVPSFSGLQDQLIERLGSADGVDLARIKLASPVSRLLRLSLGHWFALLAGHQERHLWQARRVRDTNSAS